MYKYLTLTRVNSTIKKHSLSVAYTKGQKEFRFLDLKTGDQVGETLVLDRLHSLTIQQWRDAAVAARASVSGTSSEADAQVRELVDSLDLEETVEELVEA